MYIKKIFSIIYSVSALVLITAYQGVTPAWSASGDKKLEIQQSTDKGAREVIDLKDGNKGKQSVKKKAVRKAGTAAAVGVAGAKVKSREKGKVIKDNE